MAELDERVALVTGASRGIGQAIAAALAASGATVIGSATSAAGAAAISEKLAEQGGRGIALDVTDNDAVQAAVKDIAAKEGAPTILVNNAGITRDNLLLRMKPAEWDELLDTNLSALYRTSRACLRGMMKARQGSIINIGSVVGLMGNAGQSNYAAAKAGMAGFARALAREVGSRNITVNTIAPGFIETDMTRAMSEEQRAALAGQIPLGRLGQPQDIARAVVFLASGAGGYITGETLNINGGMYMA
ncbi:MAG: 3-oxoacyl-ACP reductase FabG [Gammaproteobacteria bacterium]|nr:3-oxoacyl-ACP reductase FabG [Gammaproteobacteria bacterium]NNF61832.1 3-oxoacyl-ACP reductase FabG [Gammaproteobacteria bacterium]